jgi:hypothetical protein
MAPFQTLCEESNPYLLFGILRILFCTYRWALGKTCLPPNTTFAIQLAQTNTVALVIHMSHVATIYVHIYICIRYYRTLMLSLYIYVINNPYSYIINKYPVLTTTRFMTSVSLISCLGFTAGMARRRLGAGELPTW